MDNETCVICGAAGLSSRSDFGAPWFVCHNGHATEVGDDLSDLCGRDDEEGN